MFLTNEENLSIKQNNTLYYYILIIDLYNWGKHF